MNNIWQVKTQKIYIYLLYFIIIIILTGITGCGPQTSDCGQVNDKAMHTVVDSQNVSLSIPVKPQRIVVVGASTEEILFPLVNTKRIVAITKSPTNFPEKEKAITGRVESNTESIYSYQPDLVIAPDWIQDSLVQQLRELKVPIYVYKTPKTIAEMKQLISELATLVDAPEKGQALIVQIDKELTTLQNKVQALPIEQRKKVIYYGAMGITGGEGSTFDELAKTAGLVNGANQIGLKNYEVAAKEALIQINPDVIILPSDIYNQDTFIAPEKEEIYKDPAFQDIKAVKNKAIYVIDARILMGYSQFMAQATNELFDCAYKNAK